MQVPAYNQPGQQQPWHQTGQHSGGQQQQPWQPAGGQQMGQQPEPAQQNWQQQGQSSGGVGDAMGGWGLGAGGAPAGQGDFMNSAMRDAGINYAKSIGSSTWAKYVPGVQMAWNSLKFYFNVDGKMVASKLKRLLFPFRVKSWKRAGGFQGPQGEGDHVPPLKDINCPDMYIPTMALFTFVLLIGLLKGASMRFTPEVLYDVAMSAMMSQLVEILIIRAGLYTLSAQSTNSFYELGALTGYKYVGLNINMVVALCFGWWIYYPCLIYTGLSMAFFMVKTLKNSLKTKDMRSTYFLAFIGFFEILLMWYEAYTGDLSKLNQQAAPAAVAPVVKSAIPANGNGAGSRL